LFTAQENFLDRPQDFLTFDFALSLAAWNDCHSATVNPFSNGVYLEKIFSGQQSNKRAFQDFCLFVTD